MSFESGCYNNFKSDFYKLGTIVMFFIMGITDDGVDRVYGEWSSFATGSAFCVIANEYKEA